MPLSTDSLKIWHSLEHLSLSEIVDGEVRKDNWGEFVATNTARGSIEVYMCRRTCKAGLPDDKKRYALEVVFAGISTVERKLAVGDQSADAFTEMIAFLED